MITTGGNSWLKPFIGGILTTLIATNLRRLLLILPQPKPLQWSKKRTNPEHVDENNPPNTTTTTNTTHNDNHEHQSPQPNDKNNSNPSSILMDSPKLDQRILRKAEAALLNRTSRLIIVVERCTNDHNYSAILRSAEALGVQNVYIIAPECINKTLLAEDDNDDTIEIDNGAIGDDNGTTNETDQHQHQKTTLLRSTGQKVKHAVDSEVRQRAMHHLFAQRALEWLTVTEFQTTTDCIHSLRRDGYEIWSTDLSQEAQCLTRDGLYSTTIQDDDDGGRNRDHLRLPNKIAVVFGTEAVGCTNEILTASDRRIYLPLRGFADSLNLSVATALVVHQLFVLDPTLIGAMGDTERQTLRNRWYSKLAGQRLETRGQKTDRKRLSQAIRTAERLEDRWKEWERQEEEDKRRCGGSSSSNGSSSPTTTTTTTTTNTNTTTTGKQRVSPLTKEQIQKIQNLPTLRSRLQTLETNLAIASTKAVEALVANPPEPLGDMRRADEHRTTYVGKGTKGKHGEAWEDMPATRYYRTGDGSVDGSAAFFRGLLKEANTVGGGTDGNGITSGGGIMSGS